jgi:hypothetical protein
MSVVASKKMSTLEKLRQNEPQLLQNFQYWQKRAQKKGMKLCLQELGLQFHPEEKRKKGEEKKLNNDVSDYFRQVRLYRVELQKTREQIARLSKAKELQQLALVERKEANKRKTVKKVKSTDPLLARIEELPEVLVELIGGFLPYSVLNQLLSQNLFGKLTKITNKNQILKRFWYHISTSVEFLRVLPREEAMSLVHIVEVRYNPKFRGFFQYQWHHNGIVGDEFRDAAQMTGQELKACIHNAVEVSMEKSPVYAHKLLKTVAVLSTKKSKICYYMFPKVYETDL